MVSTIKSGVSDYGMKPSPNPSGKVCTDGKMTTVDVPTRTKGGTQIPEVTLDENASLPKRTGRD